MTGDAESAGRGLWVGCLAAAAVQQPQNAVAKGFAAFGLGQWQREDQRSPLQIWRELKKKGLSDLAQGEGEEVVGEEVVGADDGVEEGAARLQQSALRLHSARKGRRCLLCFRLSATDLHSHTVLCQFCCLVMKNTHCLYCS